MTDKSTQIAVIFDFDETLTPDSTTELLKRQGVNTDDFWNKKHAVLIDEGWDPTEASLMLLVKEMKEFNRLDELSPERLQAFGSTLRLHRGLISLFRDLRQMGHSGVTIRFFVISGGLQEVIAGTKIAKELDDFWGCAFDDGQALGVPYPKNVISFTEKTKYIFQINKGIFGEGYRNKPYEVNEFMEPDERQIPLENMIYIGDGLTDIPCFSILQGRGEGIVVYNQVEGKREGLQRALTVSRHRSVRGPFNANYSKGTSLRNVIDERCREIIAAGS